MNNEKLNDLIKRVNGDFYVGVVGSVRSGKSTFINKFFDLKILPYISDEYVRNKILDELPQTQSGKNIMTVEPKFVPSTTVNVDIEGNINMNVRMVDSVGYILPTSKGYETEDGPRMVKTPWFTDPIEFKEAALLGTKKVIESHSNLGIVITSDGTISDFKREEYESIEEQIIPKMKELDKPFVVVLNTKEPNGEYQKEIKKQIEEKYDVSVVALDIVNMTESDLDLIFISALDEFVIEELTIELPEYIAVLDNDITLKREINDVISSCNKKYQKFKEIKHIEEYFLESSLFKTVDVKLNNPSDGSVIITLDLLDEKIDSLMNEILGTKVLTKSDFIKELYEGQKAKKEYSNIEAAIRSAKETGYGISIPNIKDMKLLPPTLIKQQGRYGVKLQAIAPSIHMIKVDVESTFTPIIGSEDQSQNLIENLIKDDNNPEDVWEKEIFGRSLYEIVNDGIKAKIYQFPEISKYKIKNILDKLINNQKSNVIAIIL